VKSVGEAKAFRSAASALLEACWDIGLTSILPEAQLHLNTANVVVNRDYDVHGPGKELLKFPFNHSRYTNFRQLVRLRFGKSVMRLMLTKTTCLI
jgi:hypothetical protein